MAGIQLDRLAHHRLTRSLRSSPERNRHVRCQPETEIVALGRLLLAKYCLRRLPKLDEHLRGGNGERLAGADIERHTGPAPGIEMQAQGGERLHRRVWVDAFSSTVAAVLAANYILRSQGPDRVEDLELLVVSGLRRVS